MENLLNTLEVKDNKKNLAQLLEHNNTEEDYEHFVSIVASLIREQYKNYRFLRQDPAPDDFISGNCLIFQIHREEHPEVYEYLFRYAVDHGLEEGKLTLAFAEAVRNGAVMELGDCTVEDIGTGLSSILQGHDMRVLITFKTPEYVEAGNKQRAEAKATVEAQEQTDKELQEARRNAVLEVNKSTNLLGEVNNKFEDALKDDEIDKALNFLRDSVIEGYEKTF